jgi:hypothetical protein
MRSRVFVYVCLAALAACSGRPAPVLSDRKMENVLFDLYLAQTAVSENPNIFLNDSVRKQDLLQSVFQKHKISQATFDTSLVWYNAHIDDYLKLNARLAERYEGRIRGLQTAIDREARRLRSDQDTVRFEDLNLKDYFSPYFAAWLPVDSVPVVDSLVQVVDSLVQGADSVVQRSPADSTKTFPELQPFIQLSEKERTIPITQETEALRKRVVVEAPPIVADERGNQQ